MSTAPEGRQGIWLARYTPAPSLGEGETFAQFLCPSCALKEPRQDPPFLPVKLWLPTYRWFEDIGHYGCCRCPERFPGEFPRDLIYATKITDMIEVAARTIKEQRADAERFSVMLSAPLFKLFDEEVRATMRFLVPEPLHEPAPVTGGRQSWKINSICGAIRVFCDKSNGYDFRIDAMDKQGWPIGL